MVRSSEGKLCNLQETKLLIEEGKLLVIAAPDNLLRELPDGNWIGGSNPYMIDKNGGKESTDSLYVKDFSDISEESKFNTYTVDDIKDITKEGYDNGIIIVIMPVFSDVLEEFGLNAPNFENQYANPLVGWVSGNSLADTKKGTGSCYVGNTRFTDKAVVLNIKMPEDKIARVEIVNPLEPATHSSILTFKEDGIYNDKVYVDGVEFDYYDFMTAMNYPMTYPIIADYAGAKINVSVIADDVNKSVTWVAPVFKGVEYKMINNLPTDYKKTLLDIIGEDTPVYSVSCLYNYLNFELEGKDLGDVVANFTWGEIAFHLLNSTHVYLVIEDK